MRSLNRAYRRPALFLGVFAGTLILCSPSEWSWTRWHTAVRHTQEAIKVSELRPSPVALLVQWAVISAVAATLLFSALWLLRSVWQRFRLARRLRCQIENKPGRGSDDAPVGRGLVSLMPCLVHLVEVEPAKRRRPSGAARCSGPCLFSLARLPARSIQSSFSAGFSIDSSSSSSKPGGSGDSCSRRGADWRLRRRWIKPVLIEIRS